MEKRSPEMMKAIGTSSFEKAVPRVNMVVQVTDGRTPRGERETRSITAVSREATHPEMCKGHEQPEGRQRQNLTGHNHYNKRNVKS